MTVISVDFAAPYHCVLSTHLKETGDTIITFPP